MIDRRLLSLMGLLWLGGCSMTPEFSLPKAPVPAEWPVQNVGEGRDDHPLPWNRFYGHPLLQKLIGQALASNRDLRVAAARMEKAAAQLGVTTSTRWPALQGDVAHQVARAPADLSGSGKATISRREEIGIALPAFELDFWGRLSSLEEGARSTYLASGQTALALRIVLISQVMEAFITWREMEERIAFAHEMLRIGEEVRNFEEQRVGVGVTPAQTELRAAMEMEGVRAEWVELTRQKELAANALQLLLGASWERDLSWPTLEGLDLALQIRLALPDQVLQSRPDVRAAEQRLRAAHANVGAVRAAFWPRILLTTAIGTASRELSGLFVPGSAVWSFAPRLDVPIFDFSRRKNELAAVEAERQALLAEYEKVLQQAFREVADALISSGKLLDRLVAVTTTRDKQLERVRLITERYRAGLDGRQAYLLARQELYATQQQLLIAQRQRLVNQVTLYKALGGGVE
ncbi:MAG: efflux transporter outer membrane subunit [Magnetococcales bacterium]|nr:efflux transporter outer membrane subunit [Magnetococcales bacterium]